MKSLPRSDVANAGDFACKHRGCGSQDRPCAGFGIDPWLPNGYVN